MLWGISYTISEQIYKHISIYTTLAFHLFLMAVAFLIAATWTGALKTDLATIGGSSRVVWLMVAGTVIYGLAELMIALSITSKNAALAGLIEITYPLFIALFAYLLFRESELNTGTAIGGLLIVFGVAVVYWFSR
jgi:drug/metabolite transporter (DMT)-like permease